MYYWIKFIWIVVGFLIGSFATIGFLLKEADKLEENDDMDNEETKEEDHND